MTGSPAQREHLSTESVPEMLLGLDVSCQCMFHV